MLCECCAFHHFNGGICHYPVIAILLCIGIQFQDASMLYIFFATFMIYLLVTVARVDVNNFEHSHKDAHCQLEKVKIQVYKDWKVNLVFLYCLKTTIYF